jgi:DNA-binding MarR family transcriptional regulator
MAELGLDPRHVVLLRLAGAEEGRSQLALGKQMQLPPSRMVAFVDELENLGMLERRPNPEDRRMRALFLTDKGRQTLEKVADISGAHEKQLTKGLSKPEVAELVRLLGRVAEEQGMVPETHPGVAVSKVSNQP